VKAAPPVDGRRARWDEHRAQRREELLADVVAAVRAHGAGVGMDQIAAAAGTSKAVFYRYFEDKSDLYRLVGQRLATELLASISAAVGAEIDDRTRLEAGVQAYLRLLDEDPELYRFVVHNPVAAGPDEPAVAGYSDLVSDLISAIFRSRLDERGLAVEPAGPWGVAVVGAVRAAGDWWLDHRELSRDRLAEYLIALLWHGMAGAHTEPAEASRTR
jgi:AcrR family transcriptional regulator